jgi:hypothetical protein
VLAVTAVTAIMLIESLILLKMRRTLRSKKYSRSRANYLDRQSTRRKCVVCGFMATLVRHFEVLQVRVDSFH